LVAARLRLALTRWPAWALVGALARLARDACSRDRSECAPAATNRQAPTLRNPQLRAAVGVGKRSIASGSGRITPRRIAVTLWPLEAAGDRALDGRAKALVHAPQLLMRIAAQPAAPDNGLRRKFALATGVALHAPRLANRGGDSRGGLRRAEAPPPCCRRDPRPARPSDRGGRRQRHHVLALVLATRRRERPVAHRIELAPAHAADLSPAGAREDQQLHDAAVIVIAGGSVPDGDELGVAEDAVARLRIGRPMRAVDRIGTAAQEAVGEAPGEKRRKMPASCRRRRGGVLTLNRTDAA